MVLEIKLLFLERNVFLFDNDTGTVQFYEKLKEVF